MESNNKAMSSMCKAAKVDRYTELPRQLSILKDKK